MPKKSTKKKRTIKSKSSILDIFTSLMPKSKKKNCYRFKNPYHDVLAKNVKNGETVSKNQKRVMCKIVNDQKKRGKNCLHAANSADEFDISSLEKRCK